MKMGNVITKKYKLTLAVGKATGAFVTGLAVGEDVGRFDGDATGEFVIGVATGAFVTGLAVEVTGLATGAFVTGLAVGYQKRILVRPCKQEKEAMDDSSHQYLLLL